MSDAPTKRKRRPTGAEGRVATRVAILDAAVDCLIDGGYATMSTRRVAERAGVAQSTFMHHFPSRETFLVEALGRVAQRMTEEAIADVPFDALDAEDLRSELLDQAWKAFSSPVAQAATEMWVAALHEPQLADALNQLESDITAILLGAAAVAIPDLAGDPRLVHLLDVVVSLMRGLALSTGASDRDAVDARWHAMKPILMQAAATLLDTPAR